MDALKFNFGNALNHIFRTGGPKGFLWKFALSFAALTFVTQALSVWLNWPVYELYIRIFTEGGGDIEPYLDDLTSLSNRSTLFSILLMPLGILVWMVFEGASQRRHMNGDKFRLRIGADEGRLLVVGLIWFGMSIGAYIGLIVLMLIPIILAAMMGDSSGAVIVGAIAGLIFLAYACVAVYFIARFSPAAAMTVRDQKIRFFEAWGATKGRFWSIFGSWFIMALIALILFVTIYAMIGGYIFAQISSLTQDITLDGAGPSDWRSVFTRPGFWAPIGVLALLGMIVQGLFQHAFSGPPALAAKTDPRWSGRPSISEEFT